MRETIGFWWRLLWPLTLLPPVIYLLDAWWHLPANWRGATAMGLFIVPQLAVYATTIYLHRGIAHRSLRFHGAADLVFRGVLWVTTGLPRREWGAVHMKHHAHTDGPDDPHSPLQRGLLKVQLGNLFLYLREARNPETVRVFAARIPRDWADRNIFEHWIGRNVGFLLGTGVLVWMFGPGPGILAALLHFVMYVFVLSPTVNGLCHWWGLKNFANTAFNHPLLAWLIGGETLHNNHHAYQGSPNFRAKRYEFDPAWYVIRLLAMIGAITFIGKTIPQEEGSRA